MATGVDVVDLAAAACCGITVCNVPGYGGFTWSDVDTIFGRADVLSLHCPLTEENLGLINRARLASMREGSILVNTARGDLLDEDALVEALDSGCASWPFWTCCRKSHLLRGLRWRSIPVSS